MFSASASSASFTGSEPSIDVLLVEDNPGDARLVDKYLSQVDPRLLDGQVNLRRASNLTEALELMGENTFDALLVDLGLPESQGIDTLHHIAAANSQVPIVVLTGLQDEELAFRAVHEGAEDFLQKDGLDGDRLARTLRHAIDRKQRKWELHLKTHAIESADLAMALVDLGTDPPDVIHVNRASRRLSGYTKQDWTSKGLSLLFGERTEITSSRTFERAAREGRKTRTEQLHYRKDGSSFWNKLTAMPIQGPDKRVTHLLYTFEDISEERRLRARMANIDRMLTLGTVASGVAHEINNPLSFISGNVQYALNLLKSSLDRTDEPMSQEAISGLVEALEDAIEGSHRVRDIVRDLSDLAGGSADVDFPTEQISVKAPLQSSLTIARNHIKDRAKLACDIQDVPEVYGNASKLGQVFLNILINAAQAIPANAADANEVRVATYARGDTVVIAISDTGEGIPDSHLDSLFEPFFSTKPSDKGTGLGLAISQLIVRQLGGEIEVDTTLGVGSTFRVVLRSAEVGMISSTEVEISEE
jgi:PAS domain S-box-containing protein